MFRGEPSTKVLGIKLGTSSLPSLKNILFSASSSFDPETLQNNAKHMSFVFTFGDDHMRSEMLNIMLFTVVEWFANVFHLLSSPPGKHIRLTQDRQCFTQHAATCCPVSWKKGKNKDWACSNRSEKYALKHRDEHFSSFFQSQSVYQLKCDFMEAFLWLHKMGMFSKKLTTPQGSHHENWSHTSGIFQWKWGHWNWLNLDDGVGQRDSAYNSASEVIVALGPVVWIPIGSHCDFNHYPLWN